MKQYFTYLKKLVSLPSVFTRPDDVWQAMQYCEEVFCQNLQGYRIFFDNERNLIAIPEQLDLQQDLVYLSAHIDTVDADAHKWDKPYQPFEPYEDEQEIVGRGVNDCKAGVAFQLYLSWLLSQRKIDLQNVIFTITFKEEGSGKKTATAMGKSLGVALPLSSAKNYLLVLENNVRVRDVPVLCIYPKERSNFVIALDECISDLQNLLKKLEDWNPVSIKPLDVNDFLVVSTKQQRGGHVCSFPRSENLLVDTLLNADDHTLILAGNEESFAVVPTEIRIGEGQSQHRLILSNRTFARRAEIEKELEGISYISKKDFAVSEGFNCEERFNIDPLKNILEQSRTDEIDLEFTFNIGGSDASMIYATMDEQYRGRLLPVVMGPGCRSQKNIEPQRLTHGKNETFDKRSGTAAVNFLMRVLEHLHCLKV